MSNKMFPELGGFVTSARDFIGKNRKIDPYGIFSECIFGPEKSYKCSCGTLTHKSVDGGKVCHKCGVYCGSNELRYTTFGKIKIIFPIVKPSTFDEFFKIMGHKDHIMIKDPTKHDAITATSRYLAFKYDKSKLQIVTELNNTPNYLTVPFRITGIYSLYLVLRFIAYRLDVSPAKKILENGYITNIIKVLPPNLRPVSYDPTKKDIRTPEINSYYTSILNLNQSKYGLTANLDHDEQNWMGLIENNLQNRILDQDIVDSTVIEYDSISARYQYYVNLIYNTVYNELSGKTGLIRSSVLGKIIEFSARTVVRSDPSLKPYQIKVSRNVLKKLWMPYFLYYVSNVHNLQLDYCFENFVLNENDQYNALFDDFLRWFCDDSQQENI